MALTKTPVCDFGKKAEDFKLKSIDNKIITLNDIKGDNATWREALTMLIFVVFIILIAVVLMALR